MQVTTDACIMMYIDISKVGNTNLEKFYLIQIPMQGYAEIEINRQKFISYTQVASLISPDQSLKMRWHANSPQLILKIDKEDLLQHQL